MRNGFLGLATAAMLASGVQAEEVVLEPSSSWVLDYHPDRCRLIRTFGEGNNKHLFQLEQSRPSSVLPWLVAGPFIRKLPVKRDVEARFEPGFGKMEVRKSSEMTLGEFGPILTGVHYEPLPQGGIVVTDARIVSPDSAAPAASHADAMQHLAIQDTEPDLGLDLEEGQKVHAFTIRDGKKAIVLRLGNMAPAFKAMNKCADDLIASWGLDPAVFRTQAMAPKWTNVAPLTRKIQQRYPSAALARGEQANFQLRVMVGADGRPTKCKFVELTQAANFTDKVCPLVMEEARFTPAVNKEGQPIPSFYHGRVLYRMP